MAQSELRDLAERFVDLWEEQASLLVRDEDLARLVGSLVAGRADVTEGEEEHEPASDLAQTSAATSLGGDVDMAEFRRRIAECEARLAALAADPCAPGGDPHA